MFSLPPTSRLLPKPEPLHVPPLNLDAALPLEHMCFTIGGWAASSVHVQHCRERRASGSKTLPRCGSDSTIASMSDLCEVTGLEVARPVASHSSEADGLRMVDLARMAPWEDSISP